MPTQTKPHLFSLIHNCNGMVVLLGQEVGEDYFWKPILAIFPALCIDKNGRRCYVEEADFFLRLQQSTADSKEDRLRKIMWCMGYQDGITSSTTGQRFGEIPRSDIDTDAFRRKG